MVSELIQPLRPFARLVCPCQCNVYYKVGLDLKGIAEAGLLLAELVISNSPIVSERAVSPLIPARLFPPALTLCS